MWQREGERKEGREGGWERGAEEGGWGRGRGKGKKGGWERGAEEGQEGGGWLGRQHVLERLRDMMSALTELKM